MQYIIIYVTASSQNEAEKISYVLVSRNLAACVNIVPGLTSIYQWQGKVEKSSEVLLVIKSTKDKFTEIEKAVKQGHSYDVPEIISVDIQQGSKEYLDWIKNSIKDYPPKADQPS